MSTAAGSLPLNALEPKWFLDAWAECPPEGFEPGSIQGSRYFAVDFDLTTTLEPAVKRWIGFLAPLLPKPRTLFFGQTNSEYCLLAPDRNPDDICADALVALKTHQASCLIFKDLPGESELLSDDENLFSRRMRDSLRTHGFEAVVGEALAYIPLEFKTTAEFMTRFSGNRRRQLLKKLRARQQVSIDELIPGRNDIPPALIDQVYRLFENVYNQSEIHFDKLSRPFFEKLLSGDRPEARLFLYKVDGQVIAFTYCLLSREHFIYKYIGFDYTRSREFNMYFVTWFHMLEYAMANKMKTMIAGWTDIEIKAYLGSKFTYTHHYVYFRSRMLRWLLRKVKSFFESDRTALENLQGADHAAD